MLIDDNRFQLQSNATIFFLVKRLDKTQGIHTVHSSGQSESLWALNFDRRHVDVSAEPSIPETRERNPYLIRFEPSKWHLQQDRQRCESLGHN